VVFHKKIRHPRHTERLLALLRLKNCAVSTSGDYERYFFHDSTRYHHILNPKTGYPSKHCQSVSIITPVSSEKADALSTIFFMLGPQKAKATGKFNSVLMIDSSGAPHFDAKLAKLYDLTFVSENTNTSVK
jgi:thiamine biosynthesis lipoprotein